MTGAESGFLLLTGKLGNPDRRCLTMAQLRILGQRIRCAEKPEEDRDLEPGDIRKLGYDENMAQRIVSLLEEQDLLEYYLDRGKKLGCQPLSRISAGYPGVLRDRLGLEAPGCLWAKGAVTLLDTPKIALVGSRELEESNRFFAEQVGYQAAVQGYTLVSGNARGADRVAQEACLRAGGSVISVVADELAGQPLREGVLYLSEDGFDEGFTAQRALSRNRVIHALGEKTFVAQSSLQSGGTWDGTVRNLRGRWSSVFCFRDESQSFRQLTQMGAEPVEIGDLQDIRSLETKEYQLF